MSDLSAFNDAINKRAGRKLLPSIAVSIFLILIVWGSLRYEKWLFAALVAIFIVLALREIARAFSSAGIYISHLALSVATCGIIYATWVGSAGGLAVATAIAFPWLMVFLLPRGLEKFVVNAAASTLSLMYLPFLAGFLILLARPSTGLERVITFIILVGCNDTFAYLTGILFGKHPLVPSISPKKTWEGLIGAFIFTLIGGTLAFHYVMHMHWWIGLFAGAMIVATATSGDLIESALKRNLSLKDMGSLLPGHGGVMDRVDSILLSAPAMWLAFEIVKRYL